MPFVRRHNEAKGYYHNIDSFYNLIIIIAPFTKICMQVSVQDYAIGGILHSSLLLHRFKRVLTSSARDPNGH